MKRKHKILIILLAVSVTISLTTVPAFALTESEVQDQVNAVGKESVTGNLFVWFLCAIAFLKVSQKIDSFMSGESAADSLMSYMGYTALGPDAEGVPSFSDVEIGGGHIFATETNDEHPEGIAMGMYHTDQYMPPEGEYTTVTAADGTSWYKQYATDTVERKPHKADDGSIVYEESLVKRLPKAPRRKDKI